MKGKQNRIISAIKDPNKRLPTFLAIIGVVVVTGAAVLVIRAYLTAISEEKENLFGPMTYTDININEDYQKPTDWVMSTQTDVDVKVRKDPFITVEDSVKLKPVFVRFSLVTAVYDSKETDANNITALYPDVTAEFTLTSDWTEIPAADGTPFYYYNKIVLPVYDASADNPNHDGITKSLFEFDEIDGTTITVKNAKKIPKDAQVRITVMFDCVQAVSIDNANWKMKGGTFSSSEVSIAWGRAPVSVLPSVTAEGEGLRIQWLLNP